LSLTRQRGETRGTRDIGPKRKVSATGRGAPTSAADRTRIC